MSVSVLIIFGFICFRNHTREVLAIQNCLKRVIDGIGDKPDDYTNGHIDLMGDLHTVPGDHNVKGTVGLERNKYYCEEEKKVDEDMVDIGLKILPAVPIPSISASFQRATYAHHSGPPLNQAHIGQFGTVPYHHGHSQIAGIHHVISKFMPGQTMRPLYDTSRWCSRYLEKSVGRLLEMFVPVNSIRDRHMQTPGLPYLR